VISGRGALGRWVKEKKCFWGGVRKKKKGGGVGKKDHDRKKKSDVNRGKGVRLKGKKKKRAPWGNRKHAPRPSEFGASIRGKKGEVSETGRRGEKPREKNLYTPEGSDKLEVMFAKKGPIKSPLKGETFKEERVGTVGCIWG